MQSAGIDGDVVPAGELNEPSDTIARWTSGNAVTECSQVGEFDFATKLDPVASGSFTHEGVTITVTTQPGNLFDWSADAPISAVIVKGGPGANVWEYDPAALSDAGLYAPVNASGRPAGLSHITFCWNEDERETFETLDVVKTADATKDKQFEWELKKWAHPYYHYGTFGEAAAPDANWYLQAIKGGYAYTNFVVTGTITITNPNPYPVNVTIADVLSDDTVAEVTCGELTDAESYVVPASAALDCEYVAHPGGMTANMNTVTVELVDVDETTHKGFLGPFVATEGFTWTVENVIDDSVRLEDPMLGINNMVISETMNEAMKITVTYYCDVDEVYEYIESLDLYARYVVNTATLKSLDGTRLIAQASAEIAIKCKCEPEWIGETAWGAGDRYEDPGNWATFTSYTGVAKTVTLFAGQTLDAGTVAFSAPVGGVVTITITLNPGWRFADVAENVKIQDYAAAPSGNPAIGLFAHKGDATSSPFSIEVPENGFYGVHADVEWADGTICPVIDTEPKD